MSTFTFFFFLKKKKKIADLLFYRGNTGNAFVSSVVNNYEIRINCIVWSIAGGASCFSLVRAIVRSMLLIR